MTKPYVICRALLKQAGLKSQTDDDTCMNLYLNQRDIRSLDNLDTQVRDGDKIAIIPIAAGG